MSSPPFPILYEDNHLLAISKPAGLATMGTPDDRATVLSEAKEYIRQKYNKPGNVYLGVVSRLDGPVTGVLLIARTSKAARRLTEQFRTRTVEKSYLAIVSGRIRPARGECIDHLASHPRHRKMQIVGPRMPGAKEARLRYETIGPLAGGTLLRVEILTGRKHQIRLQLASRGHPIHGDRKYGSTTVWPTGIALHSHRLRIKHPTLDKDIEIIAPPPECWGLADADLSD